MLLSELLSCAEVVGMYGLGEVFLQIVRGVPVGFVRLTAVGVRLAAPVLEPVDDELVNAL
ncbi:hypothetical protein [Streptomyces sp. SAI-041]|uniref:hypothetical protein n=1 Tax=Streptomyces sp. SAI-041 TaxID=2940548 RepID=UPI0024772BA8|nr:hypothetical protein [Streptomyces sp. SAI-041]